MPFCESYKGSPVPKDLIKVMAWAVLIIAAAFIISAAIARLDPKDETGRLKAEALLTQAKAELEQVKNRLPRDLIDLIRTALFYAFLLACGILALFAWFMCRMLETHRRNTETLLRITAGQTDPAGRGMNAWESIPTLNKKRALKRSAHRDYYENPA